MFSRIILIFAIFTSMSIFAYSQPMRLNKSSELMPIVEAFFNHLDKGEFNQAYEMFDSTIQASFPSSQLELIWKTLMFQFGNVIQVLDTKYESTGQFDVIDVKYDFELSVVTLRYSFNSAKKIAGFFITSKEEKDIYKAPDYVNKDKFKEEEFNFGDEQWRLPAILSIPKTPKPAPVVILVHGSGPNDRDETLGPNKPFRDLAYGLASNGIAVLRYDKRTKVYGAEFKKLKDINVNNEVIDDVLKAIDTLKHIKSINKSKIYVLGHSLGAMLIPKIASLNKDAFGYIILAGPTLPFEEIFYDQVKYIYELDSVLSVEEKQNLAEIQKQVERVQKSDLSDSIPDSSLPLSMPASYWRSIKGYKPAIEAQSITKPILLLQGERDYQVTTENYTIWKKALSKNKNAELKLYPKLNHLFMEGEGKSKPTEYSVIGHVAPYVIQDIAKWIHAQK